MNANTASEDIDQQRRRFVGATAVGFAAAAGAFGTSPAPVAAATGNGAIRPFLIDVPESELVELRRRISATKWPERETATDASQGVQLTTIQSLARYRATEYDWRKIESKMNALPQSMGWISISFTFVRSMRTRCRLSSHTDGRGRSSNR